MRESQACDGSRSADVQYQNCILRGVSRTFALTIPELPESLLEVVGNGYLLCRIADTIEDEPSLHIGQKKYFHDMFIGVVEQRISPEKFVSELYPLLSEQTIPSEKDLVENTERVIRITRGFTVRQRKAIERCVNLMCSGMDAFQKVKSLRGLRDLEELDRYCYHVAGVVGEMLTELFCDYSEEISLERNRLLRLAVSFGQGLQMTNILKDIWEDRGRGACWLPRAVFQENGFDLARLPAENRHRGFEKGLEQLIGIALAHLRDALNYTLLVPRHETGIRKFCLLALGMAVLTLRKINKHRDFLDGREVKITRRSVMWIMSITNLVKRRDQLLRFLFAVLASGLPRETGVGALARVSRSK